MNQTLFIVIALAVVAVLIVASIGIARRRRSEHLKSHFGREYDRALETKGDRSKAEAELAEREKRVEKLDIRPLDDSERQRFTTRWSEVQARFVDDPPRAVAFADALLAEVMKARGYPVSDFEQRAGHEITLRHERGQASTEDLRQAMIHYRALFEDLVGEAAPAAREKESTH